MIMIVSSYVRGRSSYLWMQYALHTVNVHEHIEVRTVYRPMIFHEMLLYE